MQDFINSFQEMITLYPSLFYLYVATVSLAVGSFLNVVIYRLPLMMYSQWRSECRLLLEIKTPAEKKEPKNGNKEQNKPFNLMWPLSHCPSCKYKIAPWDNIPLLSFLLLRGKCRQCKTSISSRYFFIELLTMVLSLAVAYRFGPSAQCVAALFFTWLLIGMSFIDIDEMLIPDEMVYLFLWGALFSSLHGVFVSPSEAIIGALVGYLSLWCIAKLFKFAMRKEGMGHGDFKLTAGLCAWIGWTSLPFIALAGSLAGLVIGIGMILFKNHQRQNPIPFGPFLAIAGWIALMLGTDHPWIQLLPY